MVAQAQRSVPAGTGGSVSIYNFEYELESTRGTKRVLSTGAPRSRAHAPGAAHVAPSLLSPPLHPSAAASAACRLISRCRLQ